MEVRTSGDHGRDERLGRVVEAAGLPAHVVRVAEETARRHGPPGLVVRSFPYPAGRADIVSLARRAVEDVRPSAVIDLGSSNEGLVASRVFDQAGLPHVLPFSTSRSQVRTMEQIVQRSAGSFRLRAILLGAFAAMALLLGMAGVYGITAHGVRSRRRDIGIRMAMGAESGLVMRGVLTEALLPVGLGLVGGLLIVWAVTPALRVCSSA